MDFLPPMGFLPPGDLTALRVPIADAYGAQYQRLTDLNFRECNKRRRALLNYLRQAYQHPGNLV